jgi:hypothetical protein
MVYTNIKEINMGMGTTEELKLTYKFELEKKLPPSGVEIDPSGGSASVDLKKLRALIPC